MKTSSIQTIDHVISTLDSIVEECTSNNSPMGYFAALYQKVTVRVKEEIANDYFDDGRRMEKLDVVFAKRYIEAYFAWKENRPVTDSWRKAFENSGTSKLLVIQHLLLGMNAHINLDLGIAAAKTEEQNIGNLEADFMRINEILASLVTEVQDGLSLLWPFLRKILSLLGKTDNLLVDFSMKIARDGAWKFAGDLASVGQKEWPSQLSLRDRKVADIANIVTNPGKWISLLFWLISLGERGNVAEKIEKIRR